MPLGFVRSLVTCVSGFPEAAPCPAGSGPTVVQGYVVEPASASVLDVMSAPFDSAQSLSLMGTAFAGILGMWVLAYCLRRIRSFVV